MLSQTTVIEKPQRLRVRPVNPSGSRFSITTAIGCPTLRRPPTGGDAGGPRRPESPLVGAGLAAGNYLVEHGGVYQNAGGRAAQRAGQGCFGRRRPDRRAVL
jgi:hypothetical protein